MPQGLDYEPRRHKARRAARWQLLEFLAPPAVVCVASLLTRVAIHYSYWGAALALALALIYSAAACLSSASRFASRDGGWNQVLRFVAWVGCSVVCAAAGLALVALLPISVGDGP
jgi:hypothetical protein